MFLLTFEEESFIIIMTKYDLKEELSNEGNKRIDHR